MGFFSGRVTCTRFRVVGHSPGLFGPEHLERVKAGRFLKRSLAPFWWHAGSNELLVGTSGVPAIDRLHTLSPQTFGQAFEPLTSGRQAFLLAESRQQTRGVDDADPSPFVPGLS